jgi:uncharacterized membrane protein
MKRQLRGATRSKLAWLGLALSVAGLVQASLDVFQALLTPTQQGLLTLGVGVLVIVLRFFTDKPLDQK